MANRLINEQSPYLLQHAHNPVDWYPWGDEAFNQAKKEQKPVIVSIGYAACHWCHVMERESFEDVDTASYMNENFICIKVDREEHPDVDHFYMDAIQAISGSGGWPLNAFVSPDRIPFYGGTYFPPLPAYNRPSWRQVMRRMNELWNEQRGELDAQSEQMIHYLKQASLAGISKRKEISLEIVEEMKEVLMKMADRQWGGFGQAPKFPGTMALSFLLEHYVYTGDQEALQQVVLSLNKMIAGGIYDHLGSGFARYSTDRMWLAPHFEKMLYDNALIIGLLCDTYRYTKNRRYKEIAKDCIAFVNRELKDSSGGFYSALDADSEGVEGKFYTWNWSEWKSVVGDEKWLDVYFGVSEKGNWEGTNILHETKDLENLAGESGLETLKMEEMLRILKNNLGQVREQRIRPQLDDKSLLSWNALMNISLQKAGVILDENSFLEQAVSHMIWMENAFSSENGTWFHVWKKGQASVAAMLEDYAYLMLAMIQLGMSVGDHSWIRKAAVICRMTEQYFSDQEGVFFYFSSLQNAEIPVRKIDTHDGALPSGNAVMAQVLQHLGLLLEDSRRLSRAEEILHSMSDNARRYTYSHGHWASLIQRLIHKPRTLVVSGKLSPQYHAILSRNAPPEALIIHTGNTAEMLPLTADKKSDEDSLIFVCTGTECYPPVRTIEDALQLR